jgi:peptidoglycan/LPS O-acetylase OafA/YrhL
MPGGYVGVDAFFVISGFLISAHLLEAPPASGGDLARFWARRIRRLLPAALSVLAVTLVLSRLLAPPLEWAHTAREAIAAAFYVENWSLANQALDYLAADTQPTPVQHFWSLSAEEQFYLVWPILMVVAVLVARGLRRRSSGFIAVVYTAVLVTSLAASIHTTNTAAARAYFVTYTRAWEFAVGGLAAWVVQHSVRRWRGFSADLAAWVGLGAIAYACFAFTRGTPFPGYAAALPVVGTALVLMARSEGRLGPGFLWRLPSVQWMGDVSYSVYLWHWPALLLTPFVLGSKLFWPDKLVVIAITFVLAGISKTYVEDRFRKARPGQPLRNTYAFGVMGMAAVTALALLQVGEVHRRESHERAALASAKVSPCFGAAALVRGPEACPVNPKARLWPSLSLADKDKSDAYADNCFVGEPYTARYQCTYGHGPIKVALVGNSHAGHWLPSLQRIADQRGWTITTYLVSICNVSDAGTSMRTHSLQEGCARYARWVFDQTKGHAYDLVITSERQTMRVPGTSWGETALASRDGYRSYLQRWLSSGARVVVIKDVVPPGNAVGRVPECLSKHDRKACTWRYSQPAPTSSKAYFWMDPLSDAARQLAGRVPVISMDDLLCRKDVCQPVIGDVVTYFDASHLTATYAETLAPELGARIARAVRGV